MRPEEQGGQASESARTSIGTVGHVVIAGGSGFIGRALAAKFEESGFDVVILSRKGKPTEGRVRTVEWNGKDQGAWSSELENAHAVINLAGESVAVKWTTDAIQGIRESRVNATKAIRTALEATGSRAQWVNASAIGFYGNSGDQECVESSPAGPAEDILPAISEAWEQSARETCPKGVRLKIVRIGIVLGHGGGAFPPLLNLTKAFLGGHPGSGQQWQSWIHLVDLVDMFFWAATKPDAPELMNGTSPNPVRMAEFMAELRRQVGRPWSPPVPAFALQVAGLFGAPDPSLVLTGTKALPKAALDAGFEFKFPDLASAIADLLKKSTKKS